MVGRPTSSVQVHHRQVLNECWPAPAMVVEGIHVEDIFELASLVLSIFISRTFSILVHEEDQYMDTDFLSIAFKQSKTRPRISRIPFLVICLILLPLLTHLVQASLQSWEAQFFCFRATHNLIVEDAAHLPCTHHTSFWYIIHHLVCCITRGIVKFKKIKNPRKTRIGQETLSIFFVGNMYMKIHKKTHTINPSWGLTHPPTSELFSVFGFF